MINKQVFSQSGAFIYLNFQVVQSHKMPVKREKVNSLQVNTKLSLICFIRGLVFPSNQASLAYLVIRANSLEHGPRRHKSPIVLSISEIFKLSKD